MAAFKAVLHHSVSEAVLSRIRSRAPTWLDVIAVDAEDATALEVEMRDAEVLLHVLCPVGTALLKNAPRLRLIQKIGVGVDAIDRTAAAARGIAVANMPGTNTQAVAELTLGLMLAVLRRIAFLDKTTRRGMGWQLSRGALDGAGEIRGRTVGFLGFGAIPRLLTPVLTALGARIIFHTVAPRSAEIAEWRELDELLSGCDILSLHAPLTPATRAVIGSRAFSLMRSGAILINTARGALVDEAALAAALESGRLAGAGLDVFDHEPIAQGGRLPSFENVVLTPHIAWLTAETLDRSLDIAFDNCARLRDGRSLLHQI